MQVTENSSAIAAASAYKTSARAIEHVLLGGKG